MYAVHCLWKCPDFSFHEHASDCFPYKCGCSLGRGQRPVGSAALETARAAAWAVVRGLLVLRLWKQPVLQPGPWSEACWFCGCANTPCCSLGRGQRPVGSAVVQTPRAAAWAVVRGQLVPRLWKQGGAFSLRDTRLPLSLPPEKLITSSAERRQSAARIFPSPFPSSFQFHN